VALDKSKNIVPILNKKRSDLANENKRFKSTFFLVTVDRCCSCNFNRDNNGINIIIPINSREEKMRNK
jgi:hypothetical protein